MHRKRNRLLIALVLLGVLCAGMTPARPTGAVTLGYMPSEPGSGVRLPGQPSGPDSGEPDVGQTGAQPGVKINAMVRSRDGRVGLVATPSRAIPLTEVFRWTWVIMNARYLNRSAE
jgi:hypothetical protein